MELIMRVAIDRQELKSLIKDAIREVIKEEKEVFFIKTIPYVSDDEMHDIEKRYGRPEKRETVFSEEIEI